MKLPVLLAIDSSVDNCSIAIQQQSGKVITQVITERRQQAALILPVIDKLLEQANLKLDDIDAFVLSIGPGKFTGLRISASVIQGLAYTLGKKVITVNSLQLYAQQYTNINSNTVNESIPLWVCVKAYNDHYYQARYVSDNGVVYNYDDNPSYIINTCELEAKLANDSQDSYLIGTGWDDFINNKGIYKEDINITHVFKLANLEYKSNNYLSAFEVNPFYAVNPYKTK